MTQKQRLEELQRIRQALVPLYQSIDEMLGDKSGVHVGAIGFLLSARRDLSSAFGALAEARLVCGYDPKVKG